MELCDSKFAKLEYAWKSDAKGQTYKDNGKKLSTKAVTYKFFKDVLQQKGSSQPLSNVGAMLNFPCLCQGRSLALKLRRERQRIGELDVSGF